MSRKPSEKELKEHQEMLVKIANDGAPGFYVISQGRELANGNAMFEGGIYVSGMSRLEILKTVMKALEVDVSDLLLAALAEKKEKES